MDEFGRRLEGVGGIGEAYLMMQILKNNEQMDSRPAVPSKVRRLFWVALSAAGP